MTFRPVLAALAAMACLLGLAAPGAASAQGQIGETISSGVVEPLRVAIPAFGGHPQGAEIAAVVAGDLERSGLFTLTPAAAFPPQPIIPGEQPSFEGWRAINAQALVTGQVHVEGDGRLRVEVYLYDPFQGLMLDLGRGATSDPQGALYRAHPQSWRKIAHMISDAIYERLTGEKGYFDSQIVFVAESGPRGNRVKRLMIMDQDGANPSSLTDGGAIAMTPRFSPNSREITYMALRPTGSSIYLLNLENGRQETVGRFPGMVFAPRFSPDGNAVAFSVERGGNSDIWVMNLTTRSQSRLTTDPGIDTSASFSPDGGRIAFNSDRGGSPQLYVMNADGSGVRRISRGGGVYTTPVWSPTGDFIAFTKQQGGMFHIGVMRPDGSDERILTSSYLDEGPTWAPNGRVLMFTREARGGAPRLWTVDITGRILRPAPYQGSGSDPAWSPLLN